jgi:hypothetical protein
MREPTRLLIAWNAGTYAFLAMVLELWINPRGDARADSRPEDEGQEALLIPAVLAGAAALGAIVWELGPVKAMEGWAKTGHLLLVASTILSAWTFIHVMFALHYADAYYAPTGDGGVSGGLKFPSRTIRTGASSLIRRSSSAALSPPPTSTSPLRRCAEWSSLRASSPSSSTPSSSRSPSTSPRASSDAALKWPFS